MQLERSRRLSEERSWGSRGDSDFHSISLTPRSEAFRKAVNIITKKRQRQDVTKVGTLGRDTAPPAPPTHTVHSSRSQTAASRSATQLCWLRKGDVGNVFAGSSGSPEPSTESNWLFILSQRTTSTRLEACLLASPTQDGSPLPEEGAAPQSPTQFTPSPAGNEAPTPPTPVKTYSALMPWGARGCPESSRDRRERHSLPPLRHFSGPSWGSCYWNLEKLNTQVDICSACVFLHRPLGRWWAGSSQACSQGPEPQNRLPSWAPGGRPGTILQGSQLGYRSLPARWLSWDNFCDSFIRIQME